MRKVHRWAWVAVCAIANACGDDSVSTDGGNDATTSDAIDEQSADAAPLVFKDGACSMPASCVVGAALDAAYPPNLGIVCCGTLNVSSAPSDCNIDAATGVCASPPTCITKFDVVQCGAPQVVRLCTTDSECTESNYAQCCSAPAGDASVHFCANEAYAFALNGNCP